MTVQWSIELLAKCHNRGSFDCGEPSLNNYLSRYARQNADLGVSKTYVLVKTGNLAVVGYYTVLAGSITLESLAPNDRRRLPKYPVPTAHLARLAVDCEFQGRGFGEALLFDCLKRTCLVSQEIAVYALTVRALHGKAKRFYEQYGFIELAGDPLHLYMLIATASSLIAGPSFPTASSPPSSQ